MSRSSWLSSYRWCAFLSILQALSSIDTLAPAARTLPFQPSLIQAHCAMTIQPNLIAL
jgi:hypothetical protein